MSNNFRVGQKVVCIWDGFEKLCQYGEIAPKLNQIYTIRAIFYPSDEFTGFHFAEIINAPRKYIEIFGEIRFSSCQFRPVVDRPTDISIFHEILAKENSRCETIANLRKMSENILNQCQDV